MDDGTGARGGPHDTPALPLIRVLAQVRWPVMTGFSVDSSADTLAERISSRFPLRESGNEVTLMITPEGVTQKTGGQLHKFSDGEGWDATFGSTFITLETSAYTGHDDFIERLVYVVREVKELLPLQRWDRIGYRYTNQLIGDDVARLPEYFEPAILGTQTLGFADELVHCVSETIYSGQNASLLVKTALLQPNARLEPTIPATPNRSWILDLDAFIEGPSKDFSDENITAQAGRLSAKAHEFFEKVTRDGFRKRFEN